MGQERADRALRQSQGTDNDVTFHLEQGVGVVKQKEQKGADRDEQEEDRHDIRELCHRGGFEHDRRARRERQKHKKRLRAIDPWCLLVVGPSRP
jgi:hypothetical protein